MPFSFLLGSPIEEILSLSRHESLFLRAISTSIAVMQAHFAHVHFLNCAFLKKTCATIAKFCALLCRFSHVVCIVNVVRVASNLRLSDSLWPAAISEEVQRFRGATLESILQSTEVGSREANSNCFLLPKGFFVYSSMSVFTTKRAPVRDDSP